MFGIGIGPLIILQPGNQSTGGGIKNRVLNLLRCAHWVINGLNFVPLLISQTSIYVL